jgi:hypothetical protein
VTEETRIPDVPVSAAEKTEMRLRPGADACVAVDPWPFRTDRVSVQAEGRRLLGRFSDEEAMRRAFDAAEPVLIRATLVPA